MQQLEKNSNYTNETFESIKHVDETGAEYWYARELQKILEYTEWRKFENVINKAIISCESTGISRFEHFVGADKMVLIGSGAKRKGLRYREDILDNMGSEELAANLFRITQTESRLKRDNISTESAANKTHYEVGSKIRNTIKELGGTMPEDLPTPEKSLKQLEKEKKKLLEVK